MKNLDKLERVLEGIWSGELEHDQRYDICGSARCVCGWYMELNYEGSTYGEGTVLYNEERESAWTWTEEELDLNPLEAYLLFCSESTESLQKLVLKALKAGRRLRNYSYEDVDVFSDNYRGRFEIYIDIEDDDEYYEEVRIYLSKFLDYEIE